MNDDFFSIVSNFSKYSPYSLSNNLDAGYTWNCDLYGQSYQDVKNNRILLNVNYIGAETVYIERPNKH